jgi:asparagine synthase (glutamine-hydrolysing)
MCGIGGIVGGLVAGADDDLASIQKALRHRGPDDEGCYINPSRDVGLVHTRLAILDLSAAGHQPMHSQEGRFTVVFNGEIYNFADLRRDLINRGFQPRSNSDTEVLLELYSKFGPAMLGRLAGMFAVAIWDNLQRSLFLARDPLGIKPLYYALENGKLIFASEVRAILKSRLIASKQLDFSAAYRYLLFGSVQDPDTLVQGIAQLPAGYYGLYSENKLSIKKYWEMKYAEANEALVDSASSVASVRSSLDDSIRRHLVSDVPVGILLSGGIDSTAVLALANSVGADSLRTFCISFGSAAYDEGPIASRTAAHFGSDHSEWRMEFDEGKSLMTDYMHSLDLPSNDGFNTYCVSLFAKRHGMKVVLSGLGGDELFGGYPSFSRLPKLVRLRRTFGPFSRAVATILSGGSKLASGAIRFQLLRLAAFLRSSGSVKAAYMANRSFFLPSEAKLILKQVFGRNIEVDSDNALEELRDIPILENAVGYLESVLYMRNQLLRDSDVMSMSQGLELRLPLADSRLTDAVNRIPSSFRYRPNKQLLLDAIPEVPRWVSERPKQGFRFPFGDWVSANWEKKLDISQLTSVSAGEWYRKWTLMALVNFINANDISA